MSTTAVCPGSFDPVTNGHVDIVQRTASRFDEVVVAVLGNPSKASGMFTLDERVGLLEQAVAHVPGVRVVQHHGLLVDLCVELAASTIVKGLRGSGDLEYEIQMAQMNQHLTGVETLFLPTAPAWAFVSSSLVKEVARHGGDVAGLVPDHVLTAMAERH